MARPALEVADILRDHGPAWREANRGHVSLEQLKVMSAIERCRTEALGGHVARCEGGSRTGAPAGRSTVPRFQSPPRRTQHADFPHCAPPFASRHRLWDLSCWGNFRPVASPSVGVE